MRIKDISNEVAYYMRPYLMDECHLNVDRMYEGVIPLYAQLFSYTRKFIRDKFGAESVSADGPIPVHLLGKFWSANWFIHKRLSSLIAFSVAKPIFRVIRMYAKIRIEPPVLWNRFFFTHKRENSYNSA